ncbi:MAG TPA: LysR family transcriptional regulator [Alphaproteobacteria bacterium]|jgi:DNA-binding transcriptional LysR family regulator
MNDRQLRYAIAVWRERSFSRAAEKLGVSQPSLSEQVRLLEDELGFSLFDRSSRGVEASINGRTFLQNADDVVIGMSALKDLARELRGSLGSTLRVGICSGIAHVMVPQISQVLQSFSSGIRLDLVTTTTRRIHRFVESTRLDVGLLLEGDPNSLPHELRVTRLSDSDLVLLAAPQHPVAGIARPIDLAAINEYPLIANETRIGYGRQVLAMFAAQGLSPKIAADCDNLESLKLMVMAGTGLAVVPRIAAEREIASGELLALPLRPRHRVALLLVRRNETMPLRVEQCVERLTQVLSEVAPLTPA